MAFRIKLKRLVKIALITSIIIVVFICVHYDLLCYDLIYEPEIKLKNLNPVLKQNDYSLAQWSPLICNTFAIYSSFLIDHQIVTIGLLQLDKSAKVKFECRFKGQIFNAEIEILPDHRYKKYSAIKIKCNLKQSENLFFDEFYPKNLSVQIKMHNKDDVNCDSNLIPIERVYNTLKLIEPKNLTVCVRPFFGPFKAIASLLEFIAFYRVNLVNKFVFYNYSSSLQVKSLLSSMPFVHVNQFDIPINTNEINIGGQHIQIADCLLRNANDYVIIVDVDEFIITFQHENLKSFILLNINKSIGSFIFANTFFCNGFNQRQRNVFPRILNHDIRQTSEWPIGEASKYIVIKPLSVASQGVHVITRWNNSNSQNSNDQLVNVFVNRNEAMMFHYRSCCSYWKTYYKITEEIRILYKVSYDYTIVDNRMNKFAHQILNFLNYYIEDQG